MDTLFLDIFFLSFFELDSFAETADNDHLPPQRLHDLRPNRSRRRYPHIGQTADVGVSW